MNRIFSILAICFFSLLMFVSLNVQISSAGAPINTTERGWYDNLGFHNPSNNNYIAGRYDVENEVFRDFFVFDLSSVDTPVCAASLVLFNPAVFGYESPDPTETYEIYDVTANISDLINGVNAVTGLQTYNDLGSGVSFGSTTVSVADNGQFVTVNLNNAGINALNAAAGGQMAIGGALTTIGQNIIPEAIFSGSGGVNPQDGNTFLNLEFCPPSGPTIIIPTMGQWGMIIASIILGFFAVIALRRRSES